LVAVALLGAAMAGEAPSPARADSLVVDLLDNLIGHATGRYVPKGETAAVREAPRASADFLYPRGPSPDLSFYDTEPPQVVIVEQAPPPVPAWTLPHVIIGTALTAALVGSVFYWAHEPRHYGAFHSSHGGHHGGYRSFDGSGHWGHRRR